MQELLDRLRDKAAEAECPRYGRPVLFFERNRGRFQGEAETTRTSLQRMGVVRCGTPLCKNYLRRTDSACQTWLRRCVSRSPEWFRIPVSASPATTKRHE